MDLNHRPLVPNQDVEIPKALQASHLRLDYTQDLPSVGPHGTQTPHVPTFLSQVVRGYSPVTSTSLR